MRLLSIFAETNLDVESRMQFSIITPSFRSGQWLPLCIASVADQQGASFEHIVQDSCSDDGTQEWLPKDTRVKAFIEKDKGMYDAVNRGLKRSTGDIVAYLNADEQYLPGALKQVADYFAAHPEIEVALPDTVIVDSNGDYLCHRCSLAPRKHQMWVRFPVLTSALFIRQKVVREMGIYCNTEWRDLGDWVWIMEMVKRGIRFGVLPRFTSTFTDTGENMNLKENAVRERKKKWDIAPGWVKLLRPAFIAQYRMQLMLRGANSIAPFDYQIYTRNSPAQRKAFHAAHPTSFWKQRGK